MPKKRKPKQTGTYLKKDEHIHLNSKSKCLVIGVLKNENITDLRAINIQKQII